MTGPCMCGGCHRCRPGIFCRLCDDDTEGYSDLCARCEATADAAAEEREEREERERYRDDEGA